MNRFPNLPCEALGDGIEPPPWNTSENYELTDKYIEVVKALEKYGYIVVKK